MRNTLKIGTVLAAFALAAGSLSAQEETVSTKGDGHGLESPVELDLRAMTCWDLVTMAEDDRGYAMVLLYGFASGEKGQGRFSPRAIQVAAVTTIQDCVDKPDAIALTVLKSHIGYLIEGH